MWTKKNTENSILARKRHQYIRIRDMVTELICNPHLLSSSNKGIEISKHMTSIGKPVSKGTVNRHLRILGIKRTDKGIYQRHLDKLYKFKEKYIVDKSAKL